MVVREVRGFYVPLNYVVDRIAWLSISWLSLEADVT